MMTVPVFPIIPTTQKYDWGKIGLSSKVAQFANAARAPGFTLDENAPYAELWMGTHPSSPSRLEETNETLSEHLAASPSLLGDDIIVDFDAADGSIPFLLKILAIEKALSIQTHPDKANAERLHKEQPKIYKDPNHKPEMAIALTPFTALCGFKPLPQIATFLKSTPEFAALIPSTTILTFLDIANSVTPTGPTEKAILRELFEALMTASEDAFKHQLTGLIQRYKNGEAKSEEEPVKDLVLRLESQFPGDIGVFCAFVLNYVVMEPGEAIFLGAGEPHAYVSGDIVECMATSDNVIRAGLTPKFRDIPTLIAGLTYTAADPSKHKVSPQPFGDYSTLYNPPIPEFSVIRVKLAADEKECHNPIQGPSLCIVTEGEGRISWSGEGGEEGLELSVGKVVFVGANTLVKYESTGGAGLEVYRAFVQPKSL